MAAERPNPGAFIRWKVTLEVTTADLSDRDPGVVTLGLSGHWVNDGQQREVDECIAVSMGELMRMLCHSGQLIGCYRVGSPESERDDLSSAFSDAWR